MLGDRLRQEGESEINMTPMLDVVFILLIFFIVSASFIDQSQVEIQRPQAASGEAVSGTPLTLTLDAAGRLYFQGKELDIYYLAGRLGQLSSQNPQARLLVQADTQCPTGVTIRVLDIARQSGIEFSAVATVERGTP